MPTFFKQFPVSERLLLFILMVIYVHNLFIDIMIVDAAEYAAMSAEMAHTRSFLQVKEFQEDYLDKPPFLFWISSLSIIILGACNFSYKLPSFIFLLFSLYAVYRFCLLFYTHQVARYALLIFASCQAFFLMTNDVRTDAILTSSVIGGIWLLSAFLLKNKIKYLIFGSLMVGVGMLVKGPIASIAILFPLGVHLMYFGQWKQIFNWKWLILLIIVAILLFPMCYGLYHQFDLHPEKVTNGVKGQKGLYFYFWLQSFGRITGENVWNNGLPWYFFLGSSIWDFFPWIIPLYTALFFFLKKWIWLRIRPVEIITITGLVCLFAMFSLSKYKLPHYIFVTLPFAAILTAKYLAEMGDKLFEKWFYLFFGFGILILIVLIIYPILFFPPYSVLTIACILCQVATLVYFYKKHQKTFASLLGIVLVMNVFLSFVFYPKLLTYQADSVAAKWAKENSIPVAIYKTPSHPLSFYTKNPFIRVVKPNDLLLISEPIWVFAEEKDFEEIKKYPVEILEVKKFESFRVARLKLPFLLSKTRNKHLEYKYLIKLAKSSNI